MSKEPKISILMPVFNAAPFIRNTITSICNQRFNDWELIVVDDFSSDNSYDILKEVSSIDARIKLYKNKVKGIVPALQVAFSHSTGSYITRMDADDLMPPDKLENFLKTIDGRDKTVVTGFVEYFSESPISEGYRNYESWLNNNLLSDNPWEQVYRECIIASPNWMVSRKCFMQDILLEQLDYPEDYDLVFRWLAHNYKIVCVNQVTHFWREHPARTSRNSDVYQQGSFFSLKTNWWLKLAFTGQEVQIIGAGRKGKLVQKLLQENHVTSQLFDFSHHKRGGNSLAEEVLALDELSAVKQSILCVWPKSKKTQNEIIEFLAGKSIVFGDNLWLF
jgi:glycosyltransferase involved in cell wall biosynthesis